MAQRENLNSGGRQPQDSSTPEQPDYARTAQEIVELGHQASQLLKNPIYNTVYNLRLQELYAAWLNSVPKEEKLRESLYYEAKALMNLTQDLGGLVADANELLAQEQERNSPEGRRRQYEDQQGFGAVN